MAERTEFALDCNFHEDVFSLISACRVSTDASRVRRRDLCASPARPDGWNSSRARSFPRNILCACRTGWLRHYPRRFPVPRWPHPPAEGDPLPLAEVTIRCRLDALRGGRQL